MEPAVLPNGKPGLDAAIAPEDVGANYPSPEHATEMQRLYDEALAKQNQQGISFDRVHLNFFFFN